MEKTYRFTGETPEQRDFAEKAVAAALVHDTMKDTSHAREIVNSIVERVRASVAVNGASLADAILSDIPFETRQTFLKKLREIAAVLKVPASKFVAMVSAMAYKIRKHLSADFEKRFVKGTSAMMLAACVLMSSGQTVMANGPSLSSMIQGIADAKSAIENFDTGKSENAKTQSATAIDYSDSRIYWQTPTVDEIASGKERYRKGDESNDSFYAVVRAVEELFDDNGKRFPDKSGASLPKSTASELFAIYKGKHNTEYTKKGKIEDVIDFVSKALHLDMKYSATEKTDIKRALSAGDVVVVTADVGKMREIVDGIPGTNLNGTSDKETKKDERRTFLIVGYARDTDSYIVSNSEKPVQSVDSLGYSLVPVKDMEYAMGDESSFRLSLGGRTSDIEFAQKRLYDPFGSDIRFHRTIAGETLAAVRNEAYSTVVLLDGVTKKFSNGRSIPHEEVASILQETVMNLESIREMIAISTDYLKKHAGEMDFQFGMPELPISKIEKLVAAGNYREAAEVTKTLDDILIHKVAPILFAAGNIVEERYLDSRDPLAAVTEIENELKEISFASQSRGPEYYRTLYHRLESVVRTIEQSPDAGKHEKDLVAGIRDGIIPVVKSAFTVAREEDDVPEIASIVREEMTGVVSSAESKLKEFVFKRLGQVSPETTKDVKTMMAIANMPLAELRDFSAEMEKGKTFSPSQALRTVAKKASERQDRNNEENLAYSSPSR